MKLTILLLLLSASCIAAPDCITNGGAAVYGSSLCLELSRIEQRVIQARVPGMPEKSSMKGWTVIVHSDAWKPEDIGYVVNGLTRCSQKLIEINDKTWRESTWAHELFHAREDCTPADHSNWVERGVFNAIAWASGTGI